MHRLITLYIILLLTEALPRIIPHVLTDIKVRILIDMQLIGFLQQQTQHVRLLKSHGEIDRHFIALPPPVVHHEVQKLALFLILLGVVDVRPVNVEHLVEGVVLLEIRHIHGFGELH